MWAYFRGICSEDFSQVSWSTGASLRLAATNRSLTAMVCKTGSFRIHNGQTNSPDFPAGSLIFTAAGRERDFTLSEGFSAITTEFDMSLVEKVCSSWLGVPVGEPLVPQEGIASRELCQQWLLITQLFDQVETLAEDGPWLLQKLQELAITAILQGHPNNYTKYLASPRAATRSSVDRALTYIQESVTPALSAVDVAQFTGCSLASLSLGFRDHMGMSIREYIYAVLHERKYCSVLPIGAREAAQVALRRAGFLAIAQEEASNRTTTAATQNGTRRVRVMPQQSKLGAPLAENKLAFLRRHILSSLSKPLKISELAGLAGMSVTSFSIAFKQAFGVSPAKYIMQERLRRAQWLLVNTSKSVALIADETGFSSQAHLTTALKRLHGATPGRIRRGWS